MNDKKDYTKPSRVGNWFTRLFRNDKKELSFLEEEQMQSPMRTMLRNFFSNKLSMTGLIVFILVFLVMIFGPYVVKIDLSHSDESQKNLSPGFNIMKMPGELKDNVAQIAVGRNFSIGLSKDGKVYTWGKTKITAKIDLKNIPDEVRNAKITHVGIGSDHAIAVDENGKIYGWGSDRLNQLQFPDELRNGIPGGVKYLACGFQVTALITGEGKLYTWGNEVMVDVRVDRELQGQYEKTVFSANVMYSLLSDGSVRSYGKTADGIPEGASSGVVDIAGGSGTAAALKENGEVIVWGNAKKGESNIPETSSKIVAIYGGAQHYTGLLEDGGVVAWGSDGFGQTKIPKSLENADIGYLASGSFQNYAVTSEGKVVTWGLKGYLMGTDYLGRDMFIRLINGGRMTMTIGAVAVVISTIIGIIVGCLSGYFGGKLDMFLQRLSEIVNSLPFLPFALLLSAVIGTRISDTNRMMLIMVVLGVLSWPGLARLIRAQMLAEREKEFVTAAKAVGVREVGIAFRHILPNVISVIIVSATLDFATCMLTEASLSYLGFGVQAPAPTWGSMLYGSSDSQTIQQFWWRWVFPAAALGICTVCINLIGDGLRDALDPKSNLR